MKTILILNKIDLIPKEQLLEKIEMYSKEYDFEAVIPISALDRKNVDIILGLKLPGLYPVINNFIFKFRNERQINYNKNEYLLRDNDYENNGIEEKKKYLTELKKMDESTFIIISKNELLKQQIQMR